MLPIPIASSSAPSSRELFPEERPSSSRCGKLSAWDLLVLVTIAGLLVLYSTDRSASAWEGTEDKPLGAPPPPPQPFDTSSLSQLKQELTQYYHGKDVSLAFPSRDQAVAQVARQIAQKRRLGKQRFVLAYISNGELEGDTDAEDFYLTLVNQTLAGLFQSVANLELEIRRVALLNHSPTSILACLDTHLGGEEVDLVHFSFPHAEFDAAWLSSSFRNKLVHVVAAKLDQAQQSQLLPTDHVSWLSLDVGLKHVLNYAHHQWGEIGDGLHSHTRSAKPGVVWENWVPGALGHQFLADATSMLLIQALERAGEGETTTPSPSEPEAGSMCYSTHTPLFGSPSIALQDAGNWRRAVPGEQEAYWEPGTQAGNLVFAIPQAAAAPTAIELYVCCCCSQVCAQEQLLTGAEFSLEHGAVQLDPSSSRSDCLLVTANLTTPNRLTISPSSSRPLLRIARILVVATKTNKLN